MAAAVEDLGVAAVAGVAVDESVHHREVAVAAEEVLEEAEEAGAAVDASAQWKNLSLNLSRMSAP